MQIFFHYLSSVKCVDVDSNATASALKKLAANIFGLSTNLPLVLLGLNGHNGLVPNQSVRVSQEIVGGGKNMSEGDKVLSLQSINCLICRKCYSRNPLKAKTCRKSGCGNASDLRPKKVFTKKK